MTSGGPNNASLFYVFYLYREAFQFSRMGSASAIAWVLFIIIMLLTYTVFKTSKKWVYYEGDEAR
jgi:multiple sugar transport system permease protein